MKNFELVLVVLLAASGVAFGAQTMDESFGADGRMVGAADSGWSRPAAALVGENQGSYFFDVAFDEAQPPKNVMRTIATLRTASRLTLGFVSFGDGRMHFGFSDLDKTYGYDFPEVLKPGERHAFGVTWDGEAVRLYLDGVCVHSGAQPLPVKAKVTDFHLGPYKDGWHGPRVWANDVRVFRVRTWDEARTAADVAAEAGLRPQPLIEARRPLLCIPARAADVAAPVIDGRLDEDAWKFAGSLPQLIRSNFRGKSGEIPPHGFRMFYDRDNLYLAVTTVFPGRKPYIDGQARTPAFEPEVWGSESWELYLRLNGRRYRFAANAAGGTTEGLDDVNTWNGEWRYKASKEMRIDDSVVWTCEAAIPWKTLGCDGEPKAGTAGRLNVCRSWTLSTFGGPSSLDFTARDYFFNEAWPVFRLMPSAAYRLNSRTDPSSGTYEENYTLAADRDSSVGYRIELAKIDGSFAPMAVYSRKFAMKKGETLTETVKVQTSVPGYDAVLHTVTQDGKIVMREAVPYDLNQEIAQVTPFFLDGRIRVAFKKPFAGRIVLTDGDGRQLSACETDGTDADIAFDRGNPAGTYSLALVGADGKKAAAKELAYPGIGEWARQDFHEDWVLPPFTPLRTAVAAKGVESSMYGRTYAWDGSFLPVRVSSLGEELFAAPAEIIVDGRPVAATEFAVTSNRPHHVGFAAKGDGVASSGWLEYDGVQFNRVTVVPRGVGEVKVRFRLKPAFAKYLHAAHGTGWGAKRTERVKDGVSHYGAMPTLWTGNEEKGLCVFFETRADWTSPAGRTYTLEKTADGLTLDLNVAAKLPAGKPFAFEFGFVASPARPLAKRYPFDTLSESYYSPLNRPGHRPLFDVSTISVDDCKPGDLGSFFGDLDTPDGHKTDRFLRHALEKYERGSGSRPVPYTVARNLSVKYPEVAAFIPTWTYRPEFAMDYENTGHFVYDCCPTTTASDFFVWKFKQMLKRYPGLRGIYFDFGVVHPCSNEDHGCREKTPILGQREYYRRMIVAQIEAGIDDPVVVIHNTDCVQLPAMTFTTHLLNGEHIRQASSPILHHKKDILDTYGHEMFASELSTLPWGISNSVYIPVDQLSAANGGDEPNDAYKFRMAKASLGPCLLHNTMQCTWRCHTGVFDKLLRCYEAFGVDKARFVGYWRRPAAVKGADDVEVSCYTDGAKVLAVIAQIGKEHHDQDVEIAFDWAKLGVGGALAKAEDRMTAPDPDYDWYVERAKRERKRTAWTRIPTELGEFGTKVLSFDGTTLRYHLPFHTFGIVELTK